MIADQITKVSFMGDGITKAFPFSFDFSEKDHIHAVIYDSGTEEETRITSDYYIDATAKVFYYPGYAPGQEPSKAEMPAPLGINQKITIYRDTPETQLVDMGEKYPLPIVEGMVDKLCLIAQEHAELLGRCIKTEISSEMIIDERTVVKFGEAANEAVAAADAAKASQVAAEEAEKDAKGAYENALKQAQITKEYADISIENAATTEGYAISAASNAQSVIDLAAQCHIDAQDAKDAKVASENAAEGAEEWAEKAYQWTEPIRKNTGYFEYDANMDIMLVVDTSAVEADEAWELDENDDLMPKVRG